MAQVAFGALMRAAQRKFRLAMVELRFFPFRLVVAGLAFLSVAGAVNVLQLVTGDARLRQILVDLTDVAGLAGDVLVRRLELEFRPAVVEGLRVPPLRRRMTESHFSPSFPA